MGRLEDFNFSHDSELRNFKDKLRRIINFGKYAITVMDNNEILAIIFFFITNDYVRLYKKSEFATPDDTVGGFQVYIDKMLCRKWTPKIRKLVQHELETNFPYLSEAVYHRAPNDRCVKLYRRRQLCMK